MKVAILAFVGLIVLAGCGHVATKDSTQSPVQGTGASIEVETDDMVHEKDMAMQHIVIQDQMIKDETVEITGVNSFEDGWIVIHNVVDGKAGPVIGHAPVKKGGDTHIRVTIDAKNATPELIAMVHVDKGVVGTYEFPGVDAPLSVGGVVVFEKFMTGKNFAPLTNDGMMDDDQTMSKEITLANIAPHNTKEDCWFAVNDKVYDVSPFIAKGVHPGGAAIIQGCGKDATTLFETRPMGSGTAHSSTAQETLAGFEIGVLAE